MLTRRLLPLALLLGLAGCLENTETITVRSDGSLRVALRAKGSVEDLADGYPLPLHGPWTTDDETTLAWIRRVGSDTGSAVTRANAGALPAKDDLLARDGDKALEVAAEFAGTADLPETYAPSTETYADSCLRRGASLRIERKGSRTIYVFERTLHGRAFERYDAWTQMKKELDSKFARRVESGEIIDPSEYDILARASETALRWVSRAQAQDALLSLWTEGSAELASAGRERVLAAVDEALARVVDAGELKAILQALLDRARQERDDEVNAQRLRAFESRLRETLRRTLSGALEAERLPRATRNAVLGQLEANTAAIDQTGDLSDEWFATRVRMPGTIVGGNYEELEDGDAVWKTRGLDLRDRTHVLRVVSVVE